MSKKGFIKKYLDESIHCIELLKKQSEKIEKMDGVKSLEYSELLTKIMLESGIYTFNIH